MRVLVTGGAGFGPRKALMRISLTIPALNEENATAKVSKEVRQNYVHGRMD